MVHFTRLAALFACLCLAACNGAAGAAMDTRSKSCPTDGVWLQVLGAGGPEVEDQHASTGYLVWVDGKARVLVDIGGGVGLRFGQSGAEFADLDVIAISHFHVDHSAGLPVLIKSSFFGHRKRDLPLFGPTGNDFMPSATEFVHGLFAEPNGVYRYLSVFVEPDSDADYHLLPQNVSLNPHEIRQVFANDHLRLSAIPVHHGPVPALAWRVDVAGRAITFSGDMNGDFGTLPVLARDADLLVAHNAIPKGETGVARNLHMPPATIGKIAHQANVREVVLSHLMLRTFGEKTRTMSEIRKSYAGPVNFTEDLQCFKVRAHATRYR